VYCDPEGMRLLEPGGGINTTLSDANEVQSKISDDLLLI
jgi:hypothetical protein